MTKHTRYETGGRPRRSEQQQAHAAATQDGELQSGTSSQLSQLSDTRCHSLKAEGALRGGGAPPDLSPVKHILGQRCRPGGNQVMNRTCF